MKFSKYQQPKESESNEQLDESRFSDDPLSKVFGEYREKLKNINVLVRTTVRGSKDGVRLTGLDQAMGGGDIFFVTNPNRGTTAYAVSSGSAVEDIRRVAKMFADAFKEYEKEVAKIEKEHRAKMKKLMDSESKKSR